jgi:outer membrane protein assembly factor BamB
VFSVTNDTLKELWASDEAMSNHYATSVLRTGTLYGFHGRQEFGPSFRAVDLTTGAVKWSEEKFRAGTVTLAGDRLLILRESGELVMADATPEAFRPIARAQVLPAVARGYPAISDGLFYARNGDSRANELVCLDLR